VCVRLKALNEKCKLLKEEKAELSDQGLLSFWLDIRVKKRFIFEHYQYLVSKAVSQNICKGNKNTTKYCIGA